MIFLIPILFQAASQPTFSLDAEYARVSATWQTTAEGYRVPRRDGTGIGEIVIPPGFHAGNLDLRNTWGISVRGSGDSWIVGNVDLTGANHANFYSFNIRGDLTCARDERQRSSGFHWIAAVGVEGQTRVLGSECNNFFACRFDGQLPTEPAVKIGNGSPPSTMLQSTFNGCLFTNYKSGPAIEIASDGAITGDLHFVGGGVSTGEGEAGPYAVLIRSRTQTGIIGFSMMRWETENSQTAIRVIGTVPLNGFYVERCTIGMRTFLVDARNVVLNGCQFTGNFLATNPLQEWGLLRLDTSRPIWIPAYVRPFVLCKESVNSKFDSPLAQYNNGTPWPPTTAIFQTLHNR